MAGTPSGQYRILFVCSGNTCRSPMAEGLLRSKLFTKLLERAEISSAGILAVDGQPCAEFAVAATRKRGADIRAHRSQALTTEMVEQADAIFCMTREHLQRLKDRAPHYRENMFLLRDFASPSKLQNPDIPDPIGQNFEAYMSCCRLISSEIDRILPYIVDLIESK